MDLGGKHALVTGGGTGIGLGIAQGLAAAGAAVTITGRRAAVLDAAAAATPGLHAAVMDVTDAAAVDAATKAAVSARGPISICIANAGIAEGRSLAKTDPEFWRDIMATNLDGAFLTIRAAVASMQTSTDASPENWGRVIAISSIAGIKGLKGAAAYSASKFGVIGLIKALAQDYAGRGITFNAICPAYVETDIIARNVTSIQARTGLTAAQAHDIMLSANPHGRLITVEEVTQTALWLCGPGSGSTNGATIEIAGGVF